MSRGVSTGVHCSDCRRRFGGSSGFALHRTAEGRCRRAPELRRLGLRRRSDGVWVKRDPRMQVNRQLRLFRPGRPWNPAKRRARHIMRRRPLGLHERNPGIKNGHDSAWLAAQIALFVWTLLPRALAAALSSLTARSRVSRLGFEFDEVRFTDPMRAAGIARDVAGLLHQLGEFEAADDWSAMAASCDREAARA